MYIYRKRGCSLNVEDIVYSVVVSFYAVDFGKLLGFQILFKFLGILKYPRLQTKTMCSLISSNQYNLIYLFFLNIFVKYRRMHRFIICLSGLFCSLIYKCKSPIVLLNE